MEPLGFMPEKRELKPHLTVGRWREFAGSSKILGEELERWKSHEFGESMVAEVIFFQSVLKPESAVYHAIEDCGPGELRTKHNGTFQGGGRWTSNREKGT